MNRKNILNNERGGISIMVMSLLIMIPFVVIMSIALDYVSLATKLNKLKNDLNSAVHAASLSIDEDQLAEGYLMLDTTTPGSRSQDMFYKYLRLNMGLDINNEATSESILPDGLPVNIDELIYVDYESGTIQNMHSEPTTCSFNSLVGQVSCSVTLNAGTSIEITRTVTQTLVGPSVVAIVDTEHEGLGNLTNEPLLIPAVQEVFFRKK